MKFEGFEVLWEKVRVIKSDVVAGFYNWPRRQRDIRMYITLFHYI